MDNETKRTTIGEFCRQHHISATTQRVDSNPHMHTDNADWERSASHYLVRLTGTFDGKRHSMSVFFSQGCAHTNPPKDVDVLDCLASDAAGVENSDSFADWCGEYGYDTDSRKAEHTYRTTVRQTARLRQFCGSAYSTLLWDMDRL